MSRVQLALNVSDLDAAVAFYSKLFATEPAKVRPGYANFAIAEPPLKLVLIEGTASRAPSTTSASRSESPTRSRRTRSRLAGEGLATATEDEVPVASRSRTRSGSTVRTASRGRSTPSSPTSRCAGRAAADRAERGRAGAARRHRSPPPAAADAWIATWPGGRPPKRVGTAFLVAIVIGSGITRSACRPTSRAAAAGELDRDRRWAGRADPGVRFGVRRALQPRRHPGRPDLRRDHDARRGRLCRRAGRRCLPRRDGRQPDVRPRRHQPVDPHSFGGGLWLGEFVATFGLLLVILGVVRSGRASVRALRGRRLHRRRLLVHVVDLLRQPRGHDRPHAQQHLRRHPPGIVPAFIVMQVLGALLAVALGVFLFPDIPAIDLVVPHE